LTVSECFTDIAPDVWADSGYAHEEKARAQEALKFGIPSTALSELVADFTQAARSDGWSNAFADLSVAERFYRASAGSDQLAVVGIGLERSLVSTMEAQLDDDVSKGAGLVERVKRQVPLTTGGRVLGYEPLGFEAMKFHSWLRHNAPPQALERFGVRPNHDGFIDTLSGATRITQNLKATGAEPAIWLPWLIVRYDGDCNQQFRYSRSQIRKMT
jgi:hypothetical protein